MSGFVEYTATLLLLPGALETLLISINPSYISGISNSNNFLTNSPDALETITCGAPFCPLTTLETYPLILSFTLYVSVGTCSFRGITPSNFPKSKTTIPPSAFCIIPETISPCLSLNSVYKTSQVEVSFIIYDIASVVNEKKTCTRGCRSWCHATLALQTEALVELGDAAAGIHQLLLAGEEGVTLRADFYANILLRRTCLNYITAGAFNSSLLIIGMDSFLHCSCSPLSGTLVLLTKALE